MGPWDGMDNLRLFWTALTIGVMAIELENSHLTVKERLKVKTKCPIVCGYSCVWLHILVPCITGIFSDTKEAANLLKM